MFCDGNCTKRNKKCGLLMTVHLTHNKTGEIKVEDICALEAILQSLLRQEQHNLGIQAAVESGRNEHVKSAREQNKTVAQGFLGLIDTMNENVAAARKLKYLGEVVDAKIEEDEIELLEEE